MKIPREGYRAGRQMRTGEATTNCGGVWGGVGGCGGVWGYVSVSEFRNGHW